MASSIVYANGAIAPRIARRTRRAAAKSPVNTQVLSRACIVARVLLFGMRTHRAGRCALIVPTVIRTSGGDHYESFAYRSCAPVVAAGVVGSDRRAADDGRNHRQDHRRFGRVSSGRDRDDSRRRPAGRADDHELWRRHVPICRVAAEHLRARVRAPGIYDAQAHIGGRRRRVGSSRSTSSSASARSPK